MSVINEPKIVDFSPDSSSFTEVTFEPDFKRFKMPNGLTKDAIALLSKRVYDLAGITPVNVYLNGKKIAIKNFESYVDLYLSGEDFKAYEKQPRWEVCVSTSPTSFTF